ncbi:SLC13 family permease [Schleiferilactobacillus perolens]|uniref:Di-and tricarboxylate transporter n=1 Tax=Schleiferilactobacillus perolens DSM 12744 TaxID=1423792 RepID=A0A0R1MXM2_9LACO|nr:SLC13 family permease [Schleiferilactobacillus perolens]KRL08859.1 di- and tricarboxylate transporter [Schleiferilactobacillus perolens DSM 12744]
MGVLKRIASDRVLQITAVIACFSLFLARPRLADIHFSTLWSVLGMLTLIQVFEYLHVLDMAAYHLTSHAKDSRQLTWLFMALAFFSGMFLTNDITVLTLVPLYLRIARKHTLPQVLPVSLIGMTANLGSAATPFGNPHNIFLVSHFVVAPLTFFRWSIPLALVSILFLFALSMFVRPHPVPTIPVMDIRIAPRPFIFALSVALLIFLGVFKIVPPYVGTIAAILLALGVEPHIMGHVDYALVLTFVLFFIVVSNISQVNLISTVLSNLEGDHLSVYLSALGVSQFISNVPTTILLARFTGHAQALIYGSNLGGLGTLVASMANLLTFKQYCAESNGNPRRFLVGFLSVNSFALVVMGSIGWVLLNLVV